MAQISNCRLLRWTTEGSSVAPFTGETPVHVPAGLGGSWRDDLGGEAQCSNISITSHRVILHSKIGDLASWCGVRLDQIRDAKAHAPMFREARVDITLQSGGSLTLKMPAPNTSPFAEFIKRSISRKIWAQPGCTYDLKQAAAGVSTFNF